MRLCRDFAKGGLALTSFGLCLCLCTCDRANKEKQSGDMFRERTNTGIASQNTLTPTEALNIVTYLYYYNGGGVAATDISGDGLADLYFTNNQGPNRYYINEGGWQFRDATQEGGVAGAMDWSTGVSVVDINRDSLPDIYVCNVSGHAGLEGRNELFVQQADGTFRERAADYGLDFGGLNTQAYWFDYDLDGDDDMYLLRHSAHDDSRFTQGSDRERPDSLAGDLLLRREGDRFVDATSQTGLYSSRLGYGLSAAVADFDGNGYPDIYVCNDFSEQDYLYLNREGARFEEVIRERTGHTSNFSMGSDVGDIDRDGRPDLLTLDMQPGDERALKSTANALPYTAYQLKRRAGFHDQLPRNNLQWNRGGGYFSEIAQLAGVAATDWSWSVLMEDFDGDGWQEIFVANGIERRPNDLDYLKFISSSVAREASDLAIVEQMPPGRVPNQLFRRSGELAYTEVDWGLGFTGSSTGAAVADLDGDGDMDLALNNVNAPAMVYEWIGPPRQPSSGSREAASGSSDEYAGTWRTVSTPQRGMMSQSERGGRVARRFAEVEEVELATLVRRRFAGVKGLAEPPRATASFDREPLQPFVGAIPEGGERAYTLHAQLGGMPVEAGLWLPLRVDGKKLPGTAGLWQSLTAVGDSIIIAGNWGLNSALGQPTTERPLRLYLEDLDGNGRPDPLITYVRDDDREYTLADKDALARQLPAWRRNNLSYADFAARTFAENFPEVSAPPLLAQTLAHLWLRRDDTGGWRVDTLPQATQITPLHGVEAAREGLLLYGNVLEVLPRVGRQDAAAVQLWRKNGDVELVRLQ